MCGAGVVYEPQLAKASTPCGAVSTREKWVLVPGLLELMGYGRISGTAMGPSPHQVRRNAPRPFAGLSPPRVSLALRAARPLNDKANVCLCVIDDYRTIVRGCVDPREKLVIVFGLSGILKRAQYSLSSHGGVGLMSEPQPISGKRMWLEFHVVRSGVDTGGHRYCSRVFGAVEIRGIHESEMGPYVPCVGRKCPPLMASIRLERRLANGIGVFSPHMVVSTRESTV